MHESGTESNPIWMTFVPRPIDKKALIVAVILPIIPICVAYLIQKPDLRQNIQMRLFHTSRITCQHVADFFQVMATKSAQEYQKAKM